MTAILRAAGRPTARHDTHPRVALASPTLLLGAILLLALGLRLWGLPWVPLRTWHWDELHYAEAAAVMVKDGDANPPFFANPSLFTYLIAGQLLVAKALGPLAAPLGSDPLSAAFPLARLTSALLGTATVGLAFPTGAALFDRRVGLLAALFLAVSFLHVRDSHYVVVNSFMYGRDEDREPLRRLHDDLEQQAALIAVIGPGIDGHEVPFRKEDVIASPFWALEEYERPGPTVRVYALPSGSGAGQGEPLVDWRRLNREDDLTDEPMLQWATVRSAIAPATSSSAGLPARPSLGRPPGPEI